ncbi:inner membrane protein yieG [Glarea lozoyensis ATCC 20868]|uniref:Inner membrane protein yieG n=1 Tax=Glarea lozoyensis (strain ATCC 20868 / MF5171) TaxID=1116229 RepID=S3DPT1_GLAL2|nr:inner membrane protein yieG [Glarea lozoyensis ATCC 20868]EPE34081.1 inner membrane protein yieG [Glarea lozoyensis ATCC 20868]
MGWVERTNMAVAQSAVGRRFRLEFSGHRRERKGTRFLTEVRAGLATFFAMAYIISVNAQITADSGGTCICVSNGFLPSDPFCMNKKNPAYIPYEKCVQEVNRDLITGTAAIAALSSFSMGFFANMPLALAPGMGLNAYFTYQVVGFHGSGTVSYRLALTAIFVEGLIFVLLSIFGLRQWLARVIPQSLKIASGVGIGLYLALIGLTYDAGIGAITGGSDDPLKLGGCVPSARGGSDQSCQHGKMRNPTMWLGIFGGGIFTAFLMMYRIKGAIIAGILVVSIISWPRNTPVTHFPNTEIGDYNFAFFKKIVTFHPIEKVLVAQDWDIGGKNTTQFFVALVTFLYVDILDVTATLYSMARFCGAIDEDTQDFEGSSVAYLVDAMGITIGSLFGSPPVTVFVESGAGISEGGATGITACVTGICFFLSLFFAPVFASIPSWATGCALILVGAMMARAITDINWRYIGDSVPAFLTMTVMPFTYSIAYGLITGIVTYIILNTGAWIIAVVSSGRIIPPEIDLKDPWTWKVRGGFLPGWPKRLCRGKKDFWRDWDYDAEVEEVDSRDSYVLRKKSQRSAHRLGRNRASDMTDGGAVQVAMDDLELGGHGGRAWDVNRLAGFSDGRGMGHHTHHPSQDVGSVDLAPNEAPGTSVAKDEAQPRVSERSSSGFRASWMGSMIGSARGSGIMVIEGIRSVSGSLRR